MKHKRALYSIVGTAVLYATSVAATPLRASALPDDIATDARWSAWLGCWTPEAQEGIRGPAHVICVLPSEGEGVTIATISDGRIVSEQSIVANGSRRAVDDGGCRGFETATWSQDGRRVFLKSELDCGGDIKRTSNGILALVSIASYVDVQSVEVSGERASRTVRYVAVPERDIPAIAAERLKTEPMARESARMRAAAELDFEDVVEATRVAGSQAVEGLLVARRSGFDLDAQRLRALADAGVEPSTIDVMVALTYPDHFAVAEELPRATNDRDVWGGSPDRWGATSRASCYSREQRLFGGYHDYSYDAYDRRYSRCGYDSYYSPYGYDSYGWDYGRGPVVVVVPGRERDDVQGTAVKGKGYTRRGPSSGTTAGTAKPRSEPTQTTGPSRGGETGSARTSEPKSSGTPTGRTAKPRSSGGGGQ